MWRVILAVLLLPVCLFIGLGLATLEWADGVHLAWRLWKEGL